MLRGDATDTRSDLWSLGVLLFESATGQFPFSGPNLTGATSVGSTSVMR